MKSILFIALSLILLVACKKDKIPEPGVGTKLW
jgi:hypothetical protein